MKVEIWSDIMCPFCYIGKRRFEAALEQFSPKDEIDVVFRSFELDPNSKRDGNDDVHNMLASKYGMTREQAIEMNQNLAQQAKAVGLDFQFDTMIITNTFDAHRMIHYAAKHGKMTEMAERLFKGYFTESQHVGDPETLAMMATEVGLDQSEAIEMLKGTEFTQEVRADEQEAAMLGIRGVPYFVIDRKYAVSGAQPVEVFLGALQKAWSEARPLTLLNDTDSTATDAACEDGVCIPPTPKQK